MQPDLKATEHAAAVMQRTPRSNINVALRSAALKSGCVPASCADGKHAVSISITGGRPCRACRAELCHDQAGRRAAWPGVYSPPPVRFPYREKNQRCMEIPSRVTEALVNSTACIYRRMGLSGSSTSRERDLAYMHGNEKQEKHLTQIARCQC